MPDVLAIDPGHGGSNTGAVGQHIVEKDYVLAFSRDLAAAAMYVYPSITVVMLRTEDCDLSLGSRNRRATNADASLVLSVHLNASDTHTQRGGLFLHWPGNRVTRDVAGVSADAVPVELHARGPVAADREWYPQAHALIAAYQADCVLMELGYVDNVADAIHLETQEVRDALIVATLAGIGRWRILRGRYGL